MGNSIEENGISIHMNTAMSGFEHNQHLSLESFLTRNEMERDVLNDEQEVNAPQEGSFVNDIDRYPSVTVSCVTRRKSYF